MSDPHRHSSPTVNSAYSAADYTQISAASGINVVLGLWLIIAPFVFAHAAAPFWNDIVVGILIAAMASARLSRKNAQGFSWTNVGIGVWLIVAPWVLPYFSDTATWNDIIVGVLVIAFGTWSARLPRHLVHV